MRLAPASRTALGLVLLLSTRNVQAQDPTGGAAQPGAALPAAADASPVTSAPVLKEHNEPVYPPDALRDRISATVGLELSIDETGRVIDAKVVQAAGHGFDEAALGRCKELDIRARHARRRSHSLDRASLAPIRATTSRSVGRSVDRSASCAASSSPERAPRSAKERRNGDRARSETDERCVVVRGSRS